MNRIREFISKHKNDYWFRPALVILIMLVLCFGVSVYDDIKSGDDSVSENSAHIVMDIIDGSKVHILLICVIALGMTHLEHANELNLKETKAKKAEDEDL